jgi:hypothetical protein
MDFGDTISDNAQTVVVQFEHWKFWDKSSRVSHMTTQHVLTFLGDH